MSSGDELKRQGMRLARAARRELFLRAKAVAIQIALSRPSGKVTSDCVRTAMGDTDYKGLGNAAGSIFAGPDWVTTGATVKCRFPEAHSRHIRIWRYVGDKTRGN